MNSMNEWMYELIVSIHTKLESVKTMKFYFSFIVKNHLLEKAVISRNVKKQSRPTTIIQQKHCIYDILGNTNPSVFPIAIDSDD